MANEENLKPFKPGESGNPNGRPRKGETITDLVKEYLHKQIPDNKEKLTYKDLFVKKVLEKAYKGDMQALKLLWNYVDGMPIQKNINDNSLIVDRLPDININIKKDDGNTGSDKP